MFKQLLAVFLESPCPFCHRSNARIICNYCQQKLASEQLLSGDRRSWRGDLPLFAWGRYDGQLKQAIAKLKYHNQPEIGRILGNWLGKAWLNSSVSKPNKVTVIPIPLHQAKQQQRGFNQAEVIAKGFCQQTDYGLQPQGLIRIRNTEAMFNLQDAASRQNNIHNAFIVGKKLPKTPVLLLDDIYTTGTTVKEAYQTLRRYNIKVIGVVVTAKAGRET